MNMEEVKNIPGYVGLYVINAKGEIFSIKNNLKMKTSIINSGYEAVSLCKYGRHKHHTVHKLVMWAFNGVHDKKMDVDHIDGDKLNNRLLNLRYATRSENMVYASKNGLIPKGDAHLWTKLSDSLVAEIRTLSGTHTEIAKKYAVSVATLSRIRNNKQRVGA